MDKLILLDSNSLINRAYYALPNLTNRKGQYTGAVFGYINMLLKLIDAYQPTHIVAVFDRKAPTFRKAMYEQYKATRKPMPDELASQLEPLKELLGAMGIPVLELDGFEADDIIGTLAKRFCCQTYIVTGDKDSFQLIDGSTAVLFTRKGITDIRLMTEESLLAEEQLTPPQIVDLKSLMGDSSDNIPGVGGVGEKTAKNLLAQYGTLDGVYEHLDEIPGKLHERLRADREQAYLSYKLATIDTDAPVPFDLESGRFRQPYGARVKELMTELEFSKLLERLNFEERTVRAPAAEVREIADAAQLAAALGEVRAAGRFALEMQGDFWISYRADRCLRVKISDNILGEGVPYGEAIALLAPLLADEGIKKILFDAKTDMHATEDDGAVFRNYEDILLKAYLSDSTHNYRKPEDLFLAYGMPDEAPAAALLALDEILDAELREKEQERLYRELELPLVKVLYDMEREGFHVNRGELRALDERFTSEIEHLTREIYETAGRSFNLNSPGQLGEVLFGELGLKTGKKTKRGYSTNVDALNAIKDKHPIVPMILRYREISKLKSTYLDGLDKLIDGRGALHTVFKQAVTATGRLSSTEPNLQNIPIRKPEGRLIRKMFTAREGNVLVCADYSQIELRLIADFSGDATMLGAFNNDADIHAITASQVFGVPLAEVTPDMRRKAKAVNFGIIYGISDFGLSEDIGVPVWEARDFIARYFLKYPDIKRYMDRLVEEARERGYAESLFGRRRYLPELKSSNYNLRSFGERAAMNMPLQGSASDIIKAAMLKVARRLREEGFRARLIMQVHDELIVDTPPEEVDRVRELLRDCMENAVTLKVKLSAECAVGENWLEAK